MQTKVLVTGASGGIGTAICHALADRGARLVLQYHSGKSAAETVWKQLPGEGHELVQGELSRPESVLGLWEEANRALPGVNGVINNAAVFYEHSPLSVDYPVWAQAWEHTLKVNLFGPAHLSFLAANAFRSHGGGRIVTVSSRGAFRGEPEAPAYGASKAGLNAMSQSLAKAFAPHGVYFYTIAPGWVEGGMAKDHLAGPLRDDIVAQHPLGRITQLNEVAATVAFCALDAPAAMTGSVIDVNGASYLRT